jgi:ATP-dependent Lon protease
VLELPQVATRHRRRAQAIAHGAEDRQRIGRVLCAAAFRHAGDLRGVMHELWFSSRRVPKGRGGTLEPHHVLGNVAPDLRAQAINVFHATAAFAIARFGIDDVAFGARRFTLKLTKEDEPSSGDSASLPIAIALVSCLLKIPVRPDIALSGALVTDAHDVITVRRVGDVDAKIEGAYERRARMLVLPADNREDVGRAERVPPDVASSLVRFVSTLDEACEAVFGDDIFMTT